MLFMKFLINNRDMVETGRPGAVDSEGKLSRITKGHLTTYKTFFEVAGTRG